MPEANAASAEKHTLEELFVQAEALLNTVARNALRRYHPKYQADDVERFKQRLAVLLLKDNLKLLSAVQDSAKLKPWLQRVANHEVLRVLRAESRNVGFDHTPREKLIRPPEQEAELLRKEQLKLVEAVLAEMTPHQRRLIELDAQGLKAQEIARVLGRPVTTIYAEKSAAVRRLKELVAERQKIIISKKS